MTRTGTLLTAFVSSTLFLGSLAGCDPSGLFHFGSDNPPTPEPFPPEGRPHPVPSFGQTVVQADPPPAVSGGTLVLTGDGMAVAADPDRDRVYVVDQNRDRQMMSLLLMDGEPSNAGRLRSVLHYNGLPIDARSVSDRILEQEKNG